MLGGFVVVLLLMGTTLTVSIVAGRNQVAISNRIVNHLDPARLAALKIVTLVRSIDDDGAWVIGSMSADSAHSAQLLRTYYSEVDQLKSTVAEALALADTDTQRSAIQEFRAFYWGTKPLTDADRKALDAESRDVFTGSDSYLFGNERTFAKARSGQYLNAAFDYTVVPFVGALDSAQIYIDEVQKEIDQATADQQFAASFAQTLSIGLGLLAVLLGLAVALSLTRSIVEGVKAIQAAEGALGESEARYRRITETITDYMFQVKVQDGVAAGTIHGPGCVAVTGYTPEEFAGDPGLWLAMVVPDARPAVLEQARAVLAGQRFGPIEHCIVRKDGSVRWVRNTPVPQFGPDGSLVAYDGLIQDITERRALEDQLLQAQKMESVGRLAGGVAHDFNNLLTAVLGNVELAGLDLPAGLPDDAPLRADLEEIAKAGERAASLTRQLLSFASKQRIVAVRLDLSAVVADSLKMLRRLLGEDIEIVTALEPALGAVEADPGQIQQLLVNLAVNARDAMPDGGRLVIETANETVDEAYATSHPELSPWEYVRLSVTDTGVGMSDDVRAHLFEPFFTTKEQGKGTGLGLATCHGIVRQIGGEIRVYSEPGQGTTFRILLPQVEGIVAETRAGVAVTPTPTGTETILIVEDEPAVRRLAVLGLRAQGYTVIEAAGGGEALEIVAHLTRPPDALVSDVIMPGMSGPELAKRLRELHPETRLLLMSGHVEAAVLPRDTSSGGIPFLPKPFTPERLARKLREVLDEPLGPSSATPSDPAA